MNCLKNNSIWRQNSGYATLAMVKRLFTIGYEGLDKEAFIGRLRDHHVSTLIDVREIPISRKKGFSKSALAEYLKDHGIEYVHIKALGSPSSIRHRLKEDGDYQSFFEDFEAYLSQDAVDDLRNLEDMIAEKRNICLMCYEKDHSLCHRNTIVKKLKKLSGPGLSVEHL